MRDHHVPQRCLHSEIERPIKRGLRRRFVLIGQCPPEGVAEFDQPVWLPAPTALTAALPACSSATPARGLGGEPAFGETGLHAAHPVSSASE
jgi:hypothetical protein